MGGGSPGNKLFSINKKISTGSTLTNGDACDANPGLTLKYLNTFIALHHT
jgi:hypothetical protein